VTADASLQETLERHVAEQTAVAHKREIVRGASSLMCWSAAATALLVGSLFYRAGWIPPNTYPVTGESSLFSSGLSELLLIGATVILLMRFLRFRAGVYGDKRSERIAEFTGMGIGAVIFIGFMAGFIALYGFAAHLLLQGGSPSTIRSAAMGIVIVAGVFAVAYLTCKKSWRMTVEDGMPLAFVLRAMGILIGLPVAALFGFSMFFLALIIVERAGGNAEPLRMFFNHQTAWVVVLTTTAFLVLSGLVHAGRRALRPQHAPVFFDTMVGTGIAIAVVKFASIILIGIK
jgi:hypothetical protein